MTVRSIKTDSFEMEYFTFGTGKRAFVIIPGVSVKSVMLSAQAVESAFSDFGKDYTVYLFDRRKHIEDGYTVSDMADDTAEAMKLLNITDAYVFGASQGGMIAQYIAIRYPQLVQKLVLGSTLSRQNCVSRETFDGWCRLAGGDDIIALNRDIINKVYSESYIKTYSDAFAEIQKDGTAEEMQRFKILSKACRTFNAYDELDKIKCPVLVIGARQDNVLGVQGSFEIAEKLACQMYIYEDYGHAVYDEAPDYRKRIFHFFEA